MWPLFLEHTPWHWLHGLMQYMSLAAGGEYAGCPAPRACRPTGAWTPASTHRWAARRAVGPELRVNLVTFASLA